MFCIQCGAPLSEDMNFCASCGAPVGAGSSAPANPVAPEAPVPAAAVAAPESAGLHEFVPNKKQISKGLRVGFQVGLAVILTLLLVLSYWNTGAAYERAAEKYVLATLQRDYNAMNDAWWGDMDANREAIATYWGYDSVEEMEESFLDAYGTTSFKKAYEQASERYFEYYEETYGDDYKITCKASMGMKLSDEKVQLMLQNLEDQGLDAIIPLGKVKAIYSVECKVTISGDKDSMEQYVTVYIARIGMRHKMLPQNTYAFRFT